MRKGERGGRSATSVPVSMGFLREGYFAIIAAISGGWSMMNLE